MIFLICIFLSKTEQAKTTEFERNLHLALFDGYDSRVRPVKYSYQPVVINFDVFIAQLAHINEVLYSRHKVNPYRHKILNVTINRFKGTKS